MKKTTTTAIAGLLSSAAALTGVAFAVPSLTHVSLERTSATAAIPENGASFQELEAAVVTSGGQVMERGQNAFLAQSRFGHPFLVSASSCENGRCLFVDMVSFLPNQSNRSLADINAYNMQADSAAPAFIDPDGDLVIKDTWLVDGGVSDQNLANNFLFFSIVLKNFVNRLVLNQEASADGDRTPDIGKTLVAIDTRDAELARRLNNASAWEISAITGGAPFEMAADKMKTMMSTSSTAGEAEIEYSATGGR